jgi:RNA polymerase sigma-70 factor (ECF subfamily)
MIATEKARPANMSVTEIADISELTIEEFRQQLLEALPHVRAFAVFLTGRMDGADDLVERTILRALSHLNQFKRGTSLRGWLFTILCHEFQTIMRTLRHEVENCNGAYAEQMMTAPQQTSRLEFLEFKRALQKLPTGQRVALLLIDAENMSYEDAARICKCAIGTLKSRVSRGRRRLAAALGYSGIGEIGPDSTLQGALRRRQLLS